MQEIYPTKVTTIEELATKSAKELFKIRTIFPFKIFPTEVILDELKITIIRHGLFLKQFFPILVKDIKTVNVTSSLFFASLTFEISGYEDNPDTIGHLWNDQAIKAHQMIVGLMTVIKENAENSLNDYSQEDLADKLVQIGGTSNHPAPDVKIIE